MVEPSGLPRHATSAGILLIFGAGLALYQLTSLALGPAGSRQIDLSVSIPGVEVIDQSGSIWPPANPTLGTRLPTPARAAMAARTVAATLTPPAPVATSPAGAVRPTPAPVIKARKRHEPD